MTAFEGLLSSQIDSLAKFAGTADALHLALKRNPDVQATRRQIFRGGTTAEDGLAFARALLQQFAPGRRFDNEGALAALAVVLQSVNAPGVEQFLEGLASVQCGEMPLAPRVARIALRERVRQVTPSTVRRMSLSTPVADYGPRLSQGGDRRFAAKSAGTSSVRVMSLA